MNYQIVRLLDTEDAARLVRELGEHLFVDGKLTANGSAREVKHNLQLQRSAPESSPLHQTVIDAFTRCAEFQAFALPKRVLAPLFNRYEPGMQYGAHIDNAMMGGFSGLRTDLSVTLFLSPPDSYDGGELVVDLPSGEQEIKLDSGEAVVYPSTTVHRVAPVTRGVRLAAVTWVQSSVRDERLRAILYDLHHALQTTEAGTDKALTLLLTKSYHNLIRYAVEP